MTTDGPQGVQTPNSLADWAALSGSGVRPPDFYWQLQEASGSLLDDVQDGAAIGRLTASATPPTYQQAFTGWSRKFLKTTEVAGVGAYRPYVSGDSIWNPATQAATFLVYANISACGGNRVFWSIAGGNCYVRMNGSGRYLLINSGGLVFTATNYIDTDVHPILIHYIPGAGVPGYSGAGQFSLATDKERIVGTWDLQSEDVEGLGGVNSYVPPEAYFGLAACWIGTKSQAIVTLGDKAFLQAMGWTVTGY